jgi:hypothetical protein
MWLMSPPANNVSEDYRMYGMVKCRIKGRVVPWASPQGNPRLPAPLGF